MNKPGLIRSFGIYTTSTLLNGLVPFLLLPILIYYLDPQQYGIAHLFVTTVGVTRMIGVLGVTNIVQLYFHQKSLSEFRTYLTSSWIMPVLFSALLLIVIVTFEKAFTIYLSVDPFWIYSIPLMGILFFVIQVSGVTLRNLEKPIHFGLVQLSNTTINLGGSIILVALFGWGVEGRLAGYGLGLFLAALLGAYLLFKNGLIIRRLSFNRGVELFWLGIPLVAHGVSALIIEKSDIYFVNAYLGANKLGVYVAGYQVGMAVMLLQAAMSDTLQPYYFKKLKNPTIASNITLVRIGYAFIVILVLAALFVSLVSPYFFQFIRSEYVQSSTYVPIIASSYVFLGMYKIFSMPLFFQKRNRLISTITIISAITNLGLNYVLIEQLGLLGVAWATLVAMFMLMILSLVFTLKYTDLPWFTFDKVLFRN